LLCYTKTKVTTLIDELRKALAAYTQKPMVFAWASFMYLFLLAASLLGAIAIVIAYFIVLSVLGMQFTLASPITMGVLTIAAMMFLLFSSGLNASLSAAYGAAMNRENTSLTTFYSHTLKKAPPMFAIMLFRDFVWLVVVGPAIALYVFALQGAMPYADTMLVLYALGATFLIHMLFTPALIYSGSMGISIISAMRNGLTLLRRKHVGFVGMYILFALVWLFNFIPILGLATIFFLYPVVYAAMITMVQGTVRMERED